MPELMLGLVVAVAADGPELTSAITALAQGQRSVGVGVLLGSNVFNLAALLGLGSLVAGRVPIHPRVVAVEAVTAIGVAGPATALVGRGLGAVAASLIILVFFLPYLALAAVPPARLPLPVAARRWLARVVSEEKEEISLGLDAVKARPDPAAASGGGRRLPSASPVRRAGTEAVAALVLVVGASILMEHAASTGGAAAGIPQLVTGGLVLAAVTSLPNAVAAVYLARRGRGAALMAEAMNSNSINVVGGLAVPALFGGLDLARPGTGTWLTAGTYAGMTVLALGLALAGRGLGRRSGGALVAVYAGFAIALAIVG
jgi:cation:H+ antiporter